MASQVKKLRQVNSDLPALLDEWASSLFRELDYQREAANGKQFADLYGSMEVTGSKASEPGLFPGYP